MKKTVGVIGLTTLAIMSAGLPAAAQYVNFREDGSPARFLFRSGSGLTPGDQIEYTLTQQMKNVSVTKTNACGYKVLSPGKSADAITQIHPESGSIFDTSSLPEFDGRCSTTASGSELKPAVEGSAVPTSHYRQPDGKIAVKVDPAWSYVSAWYSNVTRKAKVGKCGEVRVSVSKAKAGQRAIDWTGSVTIPGVTTNTDLEDVNQNAQDAMCSTRWSGTPGTTMTKIATWFFQP